MKKWMIAAGCLMAAGLILLTAGLSIAGFDFAKLGTRNMVTNTYGVEESFTHIRVDGITADIAFQPADELQVVCYEDEKIPYSVYVEADTLVVTCKDNRKWHDYIGINFESAAVTVYLPAGEYGDLKISCTTGKVNVPEQFTFQNAQVELTTGHACWKAGVSQDLTIQCTTGDITIENTLCNRLYAKTTTGSVKLNRVDAAEIEIKTTTGDVTGTLLSGKVFTTKVTTGDVYVPHGDFVGTCKVTTTTGDVNLKIEK